MQIELKGVQLGLAQQFDCVELYQEIAHDITSQKRRTISSGLSYHNFVQSQVSSTHHACPEKKQKI